MNAKFGIGLVVVVCFVALGAFSFMNTQITSVSLAEAKVSDRVVQAMGGVDFETMNYDIPNKRLEFDLVEPLEDGTIDIENGERLSVLFYGEVPGNFEQATSVTVIGQPGPEGFVADKMLVKCPSKYQGDGEPEGEETEMYEYPAAT
jgi:cytochrome c-type biogenesis protein CcmE